MDFTLQAVGQQHEKMTLCGSSEQQDESQAPSCIVFHSHNEQIGSCWIDSIYEKKNICASTRLLTAAGIHQHGN